MESGDAPKLSQASRRDRVPRARRRRRPICADLRRRLLVRAAANANNVGDHVAQTLTVNWGDDTISIYDAGLGILDDPTHFYTASGNYQPELELTAYKDGGNINATAGSLEVDDPTLYINAGDDVAHEAGQSPADFEVTRTGTDLKTPLAFEFQQGGTLQDDDGAPTGAYGGFALVQDDGLITGPGAEVTIPAGVAIETIYAYPLENHTPQWTETVDLTLTPAGGLEHYSLSDSETAAGCYIVNDDLYAWLDNGSDNDIFEGGDPSDGGTLVPLVLDLPAEERDGAEITLVDNAPTEADVYTTSDPGEGDTPILGNVDGETVSSVAWTYGTDDDAPSGETTLWVDDIEGSADVNDISFSVTDSDADCTSDGTGSDPTVPQYVSTQPTTGATTHSNAESGATVEIDSLYDPNETNPTGDINGMTRGYLVGQMADLVAVVHAPASWTFGEKFQWSIPGDILRGINETWDTRTNVPVLASGNTSPNQNNWNVGTQESEVAWFWVSTSKQGGPDTDVVSLTVSGVHGRTLTATTTFKVYSPTSSVTVTQGAPEIFYLGPLKSWVVGLGPTDASPRGGVSWRATVTNPSPFANTPGSFHFVQEVQPNRHIVTLGGVTLTARYQGQLVLDNADPYPAVNTPYDFEGGWLTGESGRASDEPGNILNGGTIQTSEIADSFQTYLMYLAPGSESNWVPLEVESWSFYIGVQNVGGGKWELIGTPWKNVGNFEATTVEPQWEGKAVNQFLLIPV